VEGGVRRDRHEHLRAHARRSSARNQSRAVFTASMIDSVPPLVKLPTTLLVAAEVAARHVDELVLELQEAREGRGVEAVLGEVGHEGGLPTSSISGPASNT
jgi:hypothetical protein